MNIAAIINWLLNALCAVVFGVICILALGTFFYALYLQDKERLSNG